MRWFLQKAPDTSRVSCRNSISMSALGVSQSPSST